MSAKRYKIKKKGSPSEPVCSNANCKDQSSDFFTCSTCKSPYHLNCSSFDSNLISILESNTSKGLTWYVRCDTCVERDVPDALSLRSFLLEISTSISKKVDEFKTVIGLSPLLDIGTDLKSKVDEFKSSIEKSGLVSPTSQTVVGKSVEVQTEPTKTSSTIAVQTVTSSKTTKFNTSSYLNDEETNCDIYHLNEENHQHSSKSLSSQNDYTHTYSNGHSSIAVQTANGATPLHRTKEENRQSSSISLPRNVCPHYKRGKCRHGASGKYLIDGKECPFYHPQKCLKFCRYGTENIRGCTGSCDLLHPFLCKDSLNFKECIRPNCTYAHLAGTRRHSSSSPQTHDSNNRYVQPRYKRPAGPYLPSAVSYGRNTSVDHQRDPHNRIMTKPHFESPDFHYNRNDFPALPIKDDPKITQLSKDISEHKIDISELRHSISYLMQSVASSRPQNPTGNLSRAINQGIPYNNISDAVPATLHSRQVQNEDSKNYVRQNQHYAVE